MKVGDVCAVVRFFPHSESVDHRWEDTITRLTAARAYLGNRHWFSLKDPNRIVMPRYLDYRTRVVEILAGQSESLATEKP